MFLCLLRIPEFDFSPCVTTLLLQDVNEAIQDTVSLLRVPRSSLNICCSSRGAVSGLLQIQEHSDGPWTDCQSSGWKALPGDCNAILKYRFHSSAQFILVIEKDVSCFSIAQQCEQADLALSACTFTYPSICITRFEVLLNAADL